MVSAREFDDIGPGERVTVSWTVAGVTRTTVGVTDHLRQDKEWVTVDGGLIVTRSDFDTDDMWIDRSPTRDKTILADVKVDGFKCNGLVACWDQHGVGWDGVDREGRHVSFSDSDIIMFRVISL